MRKFRHPGAVMGLFALGVRAMDVELTDVGARVCKQFNIFRKG